MCKTLRFHIQEFGESLEEPEVEEDILLAVTWDEFFQSVHYSLFKACG